MKRRKDQIHLNGLYGRTIILVIGILVSFCVEKENNGMQKSPTLAYDYAELLNPIEDSLLNLFLDSIRSERDLNLVYFSVANFEKNNADSLAEKQFEKLHIHQKGVLIFISKGTSSSRILVGETIHNKISDSELFDITKRMSPFFRDKRFFDGVKMAFTEIANKITENDVP